MMMGGTQADKLSLGERGINFSAVEDVEGIYKLVEDPKF